MYKIVMLGPPGSGKGTQAKFLAKELNIPAISTGKIFRDAMRKGSELGLKVKDRMDAGILIDDELTNQIVKERLQQSDTVNGYILDGYPRSIPQVKFLESLDSITHAINVDSSDEIVMKRIASRRMCKECGANFNILFKPTKVENVCDKCNGELYIRSDSKPDSVKERIATYHEVGDPILKYYREKKLLVDINGEPSIEEVWNEVKDKLKI
ncbi:adenylate kinase [Patescibacteria group bacterium]|nr:adenylate kinase [Patescibacteria group bacterium]